MQCIIILPYAQTYVLMYLCLKQTAVFRFQFSSSRSNSQTFQKELFINNIIIKFAKDVNHWGRVCHQSHTKQTTILQIES